MGKIARSTVELLGLRLSGCGSALTRSPSNVQTTPEARRRTASRAFAAIASNTGCTSVGEWLMTRRISLVAVCCSSASVRSRLRDSSSLNSRVFSIAMTAWSAKVLSNSICLSENGRTLGASTAITPIASASRSIGTASTVRRPIELQDH